MFDFDNWLEIFHTIKKNKLRTFLTGFSIAWGIFMLIILLASGNGLKNGVSSNFESRATNSMEVWGGWTSMPYEGISDNRRIRLDNKDFSLVKDKKRIPEIVNASASISTDLQANYENEFTNAEFQGVYPAHTKINGVKITGQGRFINDLDIKEKRKVAVINKRLNEILFKGKDPIGKIIIAKGLGFRVIGIYDGGDWGDEVKAYIPFSTAQQLFEGGWRVGSVSFTLEGLKTKEDNEVFEKELRAKFATLHRFNPEDQRALNIWNRLENYLETMGIFNGINLFVWVIGVFTLIAGVIGVSNIMLITVRERTREFGIRKALGATPASILKLILMESVFITTIFGYIGMVLGVGLSELINSAMESAAQNTGANESFLFKNPTVDINIAIGSTIILIVAGVIAGYFPARKAVKITAVEAMRTE